MVVKIGSEMRLMRPMRLDPKDCTVDTGEREARSAHKVIIITMT